jgi:hypothetical protein
MAYVYFDVAKPQTTENGTDFAYSTRKNFLAVRDAVIAGGDLFGWNLSIVYDGEGRPQTLTYSSGAERWRKVITYGTLGYAAGKPQTVALSYSSTSGASYDSVGTKTIVYGADGPTSITWS